MPGARDYVRARRERMPLGERLPAAWVVFVTAAMTTIAFLVVGGLPQRGLHVAFPVAVFLLVCLGMLAVSLLDSYTRQLVILDRKRLYIDGTNFALDGISFVVRGFDGIAGTQYPVLLVRLRDGSNRVVGRDAGIDVETLARSFSSVGVKVED